MTEAERRKLAKVKRAMRDASAVFTSLEVVARDAATEIWEAASALKAAMENTP